MCVNFTLLWVCNGGQKLTRFGPACVSGRFALARLVSVCRAPHSFTLCRSLRSSHRSSSGGLHCGGTASPLIGSNVKELVSDFTQITPCENCSSVLVETLYKVIKKMLPF